MANTHRGEIDVKFDEHTLTLCATFDTISKIENVVECGAVKFMRALREGDVKSLTVRECLKLLTVSGDITPIYNDFNFKYISIATVAIIHAFGQCFESDGEGKDSGGE